MGKHREPRKEISQEEIDLLIPVDLTSFGTDDDPCFGKHHDLKAPECLECGDSDFCSLVKAQNLHKERIIIESKQRFKDIEEAETVQVKKNKEAKLMILECQANGLKRMKTIIKVSKELSMPKDLVKQLYNQI